MLNYNYWQLNTTRRWWRWQGKTKVTLEEWGRKLWRESVSGRGEKSTEATSSRLSYQKNGKLGSWKCEIGFEKGLVLRWMCLLFIVEAENPSSWGKSIVCAKERVWAWHDFLLELNSIFLTWIHYHVRTAHKTHQRIHRESGKSPNNVDW